MLKWKNGFTVKKRNILTDSINYAERAKEITQRLEKEKIEKQEPEKRKEVVTSLMNTVTHGDKMRKKK